MIRRLVPLALGALACGASPEYVQSVEARVAKLEESNARVAELEARVAELEFARGSGATEPAAPTSTDVDQPVSELSPAAPVSYEPVGVVECDSYIESAKRCIDAKMPENARADAKRAVDASADKWREAARDPSQRSRLVETCQKAIAVSKKAYQNMGCEM